MEDIASGRQTFDFYLCLLCKGFLFAITKSICVGNFEFVANSTCVIELTLGHYAGLNVCEEMSVGEIQHRPTLDVGLKSTELKLN